MTADLQGGGDAAQHKAAQPVGQVPRQRVGEEGDQLDPAASHQSPTWPSPTPTVPGGLTSKPEDRVLNFTVTFASTVDYLVCIMVEQSR